MGVKVKADDSRLRGLSAELRAKTRGAVRSGLSRIKGNARGRVPVLTGNLQSHIEDVMTSDLSGQVDTGDVGYAPDVELGTVFQKAQPYLGPAAAEEFPAIVESFQGIV